MLNPAFFNIFKVKMQHSTSEYSENLEIIIFLTDLSDVAQTKLFYLAILKINSDLFFFQFRSTWKGHKTLSNTDSLPHTNFELHTSIESGHEIN